VRQNTFFHLVFFFSLLTTRHELATSDGLLTNNTGGTGRESGIAQPDDTQRCAPKYHRYGERETVPMEERTAKEYGPFRNVKGKGPRRN